MLEIDNVGLVYAHEASQDQGKTFDHTANSAAAGTSTARSNAIAKKGRAQCAQARRPI